MSVQNTQELLQSIKLGDAADGTPVTAWDAVKALADVLDDMPTQHDIRAHTGLPYADCAQIEKINTVVSAFRP